MEKRITLRVPDMSCGHCKAAIEGELGRLPVAEASADPQTKAVEVVYDEERVDERQIRAAIEEAGYTVEAG
ncbi:Heavy metal transport/detoxification protein [Rubrobacter xylanophilus DSM 9941]|uniref:Heavy metal transport/detoxification protein n=1 Tax=Rubrobacter xylanophilus (strain DSM 9941 / JCM 11954 / NBRC 16129 / PRD-1) TaxID=266117 RepID=Q1AZR8_RUBXD|nr:cation transporter [Rubrobacter xylanophilus]ABG03110.1 Heavy metal transport/detoxification protein [Rubrobacter xylanophilus DSM 9941]